MVVSMDVLEKYRYKSYFAGFSRSIYTHMLHIDVYYNQRCAVEVGATPGPPHGQGARGAAELLGGLRLAVRRLPRGVRPGQVAGHPPAGAGGLRGGLRGHIEREFIYLYMYIGYMVLYAYM